MIDEDTFGWFSILAYVRVKIKQIVKGSPLNHPGLHSKNKNQELSTSFCFDNLLVASCIAVGIFREPFFISHLCDKIMSRRFFMAFPLN